MENDMGDAREGKINAQEVECERESRPNDGRSSATQGHVFGDRGIEAASDKFSPSDVPAISKETLCTSSPCTRKPG